MWQGRRQSKPSDNRGDRRNSCLICIFFFQAEDGIRDRTVTGVQTCALPIWAQEKQALGEWLSVRAYDASDLEQWLEQSIPAQGWMAEQMGSTDAGAHSLDEQWHRWASVTEPELTVELFAPSVERHKRRRGWRGVRQPLDPTGCGGPL